MRPSGKLDQPGTGDLTSEEARVVDRDVIFEPV